MDWKTIKIIIETADYVLEHTDRKRLLEMNEEGYYKAVAEQLNANGTKE